MYGLLEDSTTAANDDDLRQVIPIRSASAILWYFDGLGEP